MFDNSVIQCQAFDEQWTPLGTNVIPWPPEGIDDFIARSSVFKQSPPYKLLRNNAKDTFPSAVFLAYRARKSQDTHEILWEKIAQ